MQTESKDTNGPIDIGQIKQSQLLDYDGINETLLCDNEPGDHWEEHAKNFQEEDFIKAVWSLVEHCRQNDAFCRQCCEFISKFVVNSEAKTYSSCTDIYNFFWCLWKLDIKPSELPENIRSILNEERHLITCIFNHWDFSRPMDYDFVVWFLDSGYLSQNEIDRFKMHHDYTFSSYQAFENFFNGDNNEYEIKIHVQALPDVLKQKSADDKYFSKDEFINLIKKGKIIFKDPEKFDISDLSGNELFRPVNDHFKSLDYDSEKQKKLPQAKKDYWEYVKKQLFGDPHGTVKGLLDIRKLKTNDIKEILGWILIIDNDGKFAFLNIKSNDSTDEDIFHIAKDCFTIRVDDKLSLIDFCNLSKIQNETDGKKLEFFVEDLLKYIDMILNSDKYKNEFNNIDDMEISSNIPIKNDHAETDGLKIGVEKKSKKIVGIVLIVIGVILCVIGLLVLELASKLAVVLLLLSLLVMAVGVVCLVWKQISDCVRSCVPISNSVILEPKSSSRIILDQSNDLNVKPDKFPDDEKQPE